MVSAKGYPDISTWSDLELVNTKAGWESLKQEESFAKCIQKNNFAGTAKKRNRKDKVSQRSLVAAEEKGSVSDSNEDNQPEFGLVAMIKSQKPLSPRSINAHPLMA
jgi:hypothetical protein